MKFTLKALALAATTAASTMSFAAAESEHTFSANIAVSSAYVLRGNTASLENDNATVSGGIDYEHSSGFYAGYWGSTLGYSLTAQKGWRVPVLDENDEIVGYKYDYEDGDKAFEHDFYLGYNGSINDDWGYQVGLAYYYYYESDADVDAFESIVGLSYKDFNVTAQTLLEDVEWGNAGDTYILGSYSYALPKDFSLNTSVGLYYNNDSGKYEYALNTKDDFSFRHVTLGLSKPIGDTGVTASMDYIIGGKLRDETDLKNKVVFALSYGF